MTGAFVAASNSMLLFFLKTPASGSDATTRLYGIPFRPAYTGKVWWAQGFWLDGTTGQAKLTNGASVQIPTQGLPNLPRACVYDSGATPWGRLSRDGAFNPVIQWTY